MNDPLLFRPASLSLAIACIGFTAPAHAQGVVGVVPRSFEGTGLLTEEIDGEGNVSLHRFDAAGSLRSVVLPEGLSRTFLSSQAAALPEPLMATSVADPIPPGGTGGLAAGYVVESGGQGDRVFAYSLGSDAKVTEWNERGLTTRIARDANGLITSLVLPSQHRLDYTYDLMGNVASATDRQTGGTYRFSTDPVLNLATEILLPGNGKAVFSYDKAGNLTGYLSPEGRSVQAEYLPNGLLKQVVTFGGAVRRLGYEGDRNTLLEVEADGEIRTSRARYDSVGRVLGYFDAEGHELGISYDGGGHLQSVTRPGAGALLFERDGNGDVVAATLPGDAIHRWEWDGLRRQKSYTPPGSPKVMFQYNAHSELTGVAIGAAQVLSATYNGFGLPEAVSLKVEGLPSIETTLEYDEEETGLLKSGVSSDGIAMSYLFDGERPIRVQWSGTFSGAYSVTYDERGRISTAQLNELPAVTYVYDGDNKALQAGAISMIRAEKNGLIEQIQIGKVVEEYRYNGFDELVMHEVRIDEEVLFSATYERDSIGRVIREVETLSGVQLIKDYEYDEAARLSEVWHGGVLQEQYRYDARGNLVSDLLNGAYVSNESDQLVSAAGSGYLHDDAGVRSGGNGALVHAAASGHLSAVDVDGKRISYLHDATLSRAGRLIDGVPQAYFLALVGNLPIAELSPDGAIRSRFIFATRDNMPEYFIKDGSTYRIIADPVGSARLVVDVESGEIAQAIRYDAFGRVVFDSSPGFQPFGFAGGLYDPDTGLVRFGVRDYEPSTRRWLSRDPVFSYLASAGYTYAANDPVNFRDPSGLTPSTAKDRAGTAKDRSKGLLTIAGGGLGLATGYGILAIASGPGAIVLGVFVFANGGVAVAAGTAEVARPEGDYPASVTEAAAMGTGDPNFVLAAKLADIVIGMPAGNLDKIGGLEALSDIGDGLQILSTASTVDDTVTTINNAYIGK